MVKNSFIEKTYVVGTHCNCLYEVITICHYNIYNYVTQNKENVWKFKLVKLNILNCKPCGSIENGLYLHDSCISSKFELMNYLFANPVVARL